MEIFVYQYPILFKIKSSFFGKKVYNFFNRKWFFDKLYNDYFGQFFFKFGYSVSYKFIDRGIFQQLLQDLTFTEIKVVTCIIIPIVF